MAKPKKEAKRTFSKVSRRKGSGGNKSKGSARSGRGVAKVGKASKTPKRNGGVPAINALYPVEGLSLPLASELAKIVSPDNRMTPRKLSLPFYGNYCGRGYGDPTEDTPPMDAVDAVCREHNRCYRLLGDFDHRCDRALIESMPSAIAATPSPMGKNAGLLAMLYFSLAERNLALGETLFKRT